ncbi:MAG: AAA family ATPase, partial [Candidatus Nitrosopolaris sp.]
MLFIGPPASAKTLFLLGILDMRKDGVYFDGSNTTNRILDVLEQERPKVVCIDELDKMPRTFQNQLLNFCDDSIISSSFCFLELEWQEIIDNTFKKCVESFKYKCFIFLFNRLAHCNSPPPKP